MRDPVDSSKCHVQEAFNYKVEVGWLEFVFPALTLAVILTLVQMAQAASFTNTGSMNIGRDYYTATLLMNGKVLVAGGWNGSSITNEVDLYDPVKGTWTNTGSMTTNRSHHAAVLLTNGQVLVVGGLTGIGNSPSPLSSSETYDPATGVWTATTNSPADARWDHTATLLQSGKVLVAGGNINVSPYDLSSAALYNPLTGAWTATGSMVVGRDLHTATLLPSGQVLVAGGFGGSNSAELYDPATEKWQLTGTMPNVLWSHTATLLPNGKVLVAGGTTNYPPFGFNVTNVLSSADIYDPSTEMWCQTSPMTSPRIYHTATVLPNGKLLVTGGSSNYSAFPAAFSSSEIYEPSTGRWLTNGFMNTAHTHQTATLLVNGQVLIAGGYSNSGILSNAELYASSNVTVMPFCLDGPNIVASGILQFTFTNILDVSFIAYATTNLSASPNNWTVINGPIEDAPGHYLLTGLQITNAPQCFIRVRAP